MLFFLFTYLIQKLEIFYVVLVQSYYHTIIPSSNQQRGNALMGVSIPRSLEQQPGLLMRLKSELEPRVGQPHSSDTAVF